MAWTSAEESGEPISLKRSLDSAFRHIGAGPSATAAVSVIFDEWTRLVGLDLAEVCRPLALEDTRLVIGVSDPAWASHLQWLESDLVATVNRAAGAEVVATIEIRVRPA
ncbi:MAG: hypothetical protein JJLCMIEE_02862 [Acidimicrobiales bacterium]|nr:MAG: DUF721 domain-containing protein [Actinomycetota bacterium]MBV6509763.1 hypothetical protein [Acidimicrobiales bacterium]RIK04843.1 MAG: hypothetical protein DCC48_12450 [Acidobacteriota bacterium]